MSGDLLFLALGFPLLAQAAAVSSDYLCVWAMEAKHPQASTTACMKPADKTALRTALGLGKDSLAVFDVRPGPSFGKLVATLPVGSAVQAHHTNYVEPPNDVLYANDWLGNRTSVSFNCGLFLVRNLASDEPTLQQVYDFGYRTCEVPAVAGDFLVATMQSGHALVSLDVHDPEHPRGVRRILLPPDEYPHWLALEPGGDRLVITGYGALATKARFATLDRHTGKLTLAPDMLDFTRTWPDGWNGSAMPHGAVFSNP